MVCVNNSLLYKYNLSSLYNKVLAKKVLKSIYSVYVCLGWIRWFNKYIKRKRNIIFSPKKVCLKEFLKTMSSINFWTLELKEIFKNLYIPEEILPKALLKISNQ